MVNLSYASSSTSKGSASSSAENSASSETSSTDIDVTRPRDYQTCSTREDVRRMFLDRMTYDVPRAIGRKYKAAKYKKMAEELSYSMQKARSRWLVTAQLSLDQIHNKWRGYVQYGKHIQKYTMEVMAMGSNELDHAKATHSILPIEFKYSLPSHHDDHIDKRKICKCVIM